MVEGPLAGAVRDELGPLIEAFRQRRGVPAVGAVVIGAHRAPRVAVAGTRRRWGREPVAADDCWHIGSCTKAFTAALFARLVERGDLTWDAVLPELFATLGPFIHPSLRTVTVEQVLAHRAGLPANLPPVDFATARRDERPLIDQRADAAAKVLAQPSTGAGAFLYSNLGYVVAGAAIEQVTGRPWEDVVRVELLEPLGISSAGLGAPTGDQPWGHGARWNRWGTGRGAPVDPGTPDCPNPVADNPPIMSPAGRLHMSLGDWARFVTLFLTAGGSLLRPESITKLTAAAPGPGPRQGMGWVLPADDADPPFVFGQQGSNTLWVATALISADRDRAALVVCNDGRRQLVDATARLALDVLTIAA